MCQERQKKVETGEFSLEAKCASCWDAQTPFLRAHSLPVTLRMKNNSAALPGFLKIRITIDKIFKDQDAGSRMSRAWLRRRTNICLRLCYIANWSGQLARPESMTIFQPHILLRGAQDSGMWGRVGLAHYQSVLRRKVAESDVLPEFFHGCG